MKAKHLLLTCLIAISLSLTAQATTYSGNGNTGFGGPVGQGSLTLTNDATTLFGSVTKGPNGFNDTLVLYIDSTAGGFASTSGFADTGDGLRKAISGFDGGNRSTLNFAAGFSPDYAIALKPTSFENFGGIWSLANGGANSLPFIGSVGLTPTVNNSAPIYSFGLSLATLGVTPGQSFKLFGTYISVSGSRSDEAVAGNDTGTQGWNTFTQTSFATYTATAVPEPTTLALAGSGLALLYAMRRR